MSALHALRGRLGGGDSSKATLFAGNRQQRHEWLTEQFEVRTKQQLKAEDDKRLEVEQYRQWLWSPYVREVARTHELNIAWKQDLGFFRWDRVLNLDDLAALRITGHNLVTLPRELAPSLSSLTVLSLIANNLEILPENIRRLPDSITTLPNLTTLNLSSNLLDQLPDSFGDLVHLGRLWVENNKLTTLPLSIGRSRTRIANFNANLLTELPETIGDMENLTALSLNMHRLVLAYAYRTNQITQLPHTIGNLQTLRDLRLDWNRINQLPFSFRSLKQLQTLCVENNPLKLPPIEHVIKGIPATLAFMEKSLDEFIRNARHVATILSLFEPNCERVVPAGDEKLMFFAVMWEEFYDTLLPAIERKKAQADPDHPSFGFDTTFTAEEVEDALKKYEDDFGVASTRDSAAFRKCACIDAFEWHQHGVRKRKVCIPGQVPYRCQRAALLVRMQMMTHEEAKDQLASTYLKRKIDRLVFKMKKKCIGYINSESGVEHFEKLARDLAKTLCQKRKRLAKLKKKQSKSTQAFALKKRKLQVKIDAFRKAKEARETALRAKLEKLETDRAKFEVDAKEGGKTGDAAEKRVEKLDGKIKKVQSELSEEPAEDKKILELEIAMEALDEAELKATTAIEKSRAKEMNSDAGSDDDDDDEQEESSGENDDTDEEEDEEDDSSEDASESEEDTPEKNASSVATAASESVASSGTKFFQIDMPELKFVDYRKAATRTIERELGEDKVVNEEGLVVLYQTHIRDAYVAEKCERVAQKATFEFLQMRAVLKRWMGLGNRTVFEAWRDLMRGDRENTSKLQERRERKKLLEQQNRELEEQLARLEARKWVQRTDMYTDAIYYEQTVTGETSWYPPEYWEDEQQKQQRPSVSNIPMLKLPPI
ncbi:hypothetical protein FI667_g16815, partial [Globisporangium splendens]